VALAQSFGPADYCSLMVFGLVTAVVMASGSVIKAVAMIFFGLLLGIVGTDVNTGNLRYDFGIGILFDGINFVPIAMGVFGINEIMHNLTNPERRELVSSKVSGLMPTAKDLKDSTPAILRGTIIGSLLGVLPGGGGVRLKYGNPMDIDDVAVDFPDMKIILAHPSFPWQDEAISVCLHKPNVYIDLSGWSPKYFSPTLLQYANSLLKKKMLFGSDYPLITPDRWMADFAEAKFKDEVRPLILKENAVRFFGLA